MKKFIVSPTAKNDILEILEYISSDNLQSSKKLYAKFKYAFNLLGDNPSMGSKREDLTKKNLRFWVVGNYFIIYNHTVKPIEIIRILNSYRNTEKLI